MTRIFKLAGATSATVRARALRWAARHPLVRRVAVWAFWFGIRWLLWKLIGWLLFPLPLE